MTQMSKPKHVSSDDFEAQVLQATLPVVVDFWAARCGPCRRLAPVIDRLAQDFDGRLLFAKVDVDADPELAITYQVQGIPTLLLFSGGQVARRFVGYLSPEQLTHELNALVPLAA
jgi:thioredoxin 1